MDVLARIQNHWNQEAVKLCRELMVDDPSDPMPHALMALALDTQFQRNGAERSCWEAVSRRANGSLIEQEIIDALQIYFAVTSQPELLDERDAESPSSLQRVVLMRALRKIADHNPDNAALPDAMAAWADIRTESGIGPEPSIKELRTLLRYYHAYLVKTGAMPFEVSGYARVLKLLLAKEVSPTVVSTQPDLPVNQTNDFAAELARMPLHPDFIDGGISGQLPGLEQVGTDQWEPHTATEFELRLGLGGVRSFVPGDGQPTLVVFFLGFGCAHCVAQLKDLDPKTEQFRAAGIEVISIGTDTFQQVLAAQQASIENGIDPLHFDVLCDPDGKVFKQWQVWDSISDEALHGTFLVDGAGRILWRDISERPFEESEWLLAECKRLLAAWR
jgi:peroxiredoxin